MEKDLNNKYIELIQKQILKIDKIGKDNKIANELDFGVDAWKSSTIILLDRIFGKKNEKINQINKINLYRINHKINGIEAYNINIIKNEGKEILLAAIAELETLGLPEPEIIESDKISLTLIQNQEQNQRINLKIILEAFQEELTGKQLKDLQKIIDNDSDKATKKSKLVNKMKSFGNDVITNIISNILTNPNIFG